MPLQFAFTFDSSVIDSKAQLMDTLSSTLDYSYGWYDGQNNTAILSVAGDDPAYLRAAASLTGASSQDVSNLESYLTSLGY